MNRRWITAFLVLAAIAYADPEEDLKFASSLGARGLTGMANDVLDRLEKSQDPDEARAGRYGKASLQRQQASIARARFLRDLEAGDVPRVKRDEVIAAFLTARPKIEEYVKARADDMEARFLLAELLQEYAEFLTGVDYPEEMLDERKKLLDAHSADAEAAFGEAIGHYGEVAKTMKQRLGAEPDEPSKLETYYESREYALMTNARYKKANARMRWSLIYPSGPKFQNYSEQAVEELDEFLSEHFEDIYGGYAMLDLGRINLVRGLRIKDARSDAETGVEYFATLFNQMTEDAGVPVKGDLMAQAFYWHGNACNHLARGDGKLGKKNPAYLERCIKGGARLREKLKTSAKNPWALKALLEVADAYSMQGRFDDAVSMAGEVLSAARVEGHRNVTTAATQKLTGWVASVAGAGTLGSGLLFQIGESLAAQERAGNAITFFEKAIAAAVEDEDKEKWAYPARLRIASAYRKDKRPFAASAVALKLVDDYIASGEEEDSPFGQVASEAAYLAQATLKTIYDNTQRSGDESEYRRVKKIFEDKFPSHPANSDKEFGNAKTAYQDGKFEEAAKLLLTITPASKSYWLAQRMVPQCYRNLARDTENEEEAKKWHAAALEAAKKLSALTEGKDEPGAVKAAQFGGLFTAMSHASLGQWKEAADAITAYQAKYPGVFLKRGLELKIEVDAYVALGDLDKAEAAVGKLKAKFAKSSLYRRAAYDVYAALRAKYEPLSGDERKALAGRAADLYQAWMATSSKPDYGVYYFLGDTLADAGRHAEAGDAFSAAAAAAQPGSVQQASATRRESEQKIEAILADKNMPRAERMEALKAAREAFTSVIIPPDPKKPGKQATVLKALASVKWPKAETFAQIRRDPQALLNSARLFSQSSPEGMDGRQIAIRLIYHLHSFTRPRAPEGNEKLAELVPIYWEAAELKLNVYLALAEAGRDTKSKAAAADGSGFARKLLFEYPTTGGDAARARRFDALQKKLASLAR